MWMSWADETTLLVGEYTAEQDFVNRQIIEDNLSGPLANLTDPKDEDSNQHYQGSHALKLPS